MSRQPFGPRVSTTINTGGGGSISPYLGVKGIWDFDQAGIVNIATGIAAGSDDDLRARVEGGLAARMANGWRLSGEGFVDGIGVDQLSIYGGSVTLVVPLN